MRWPGGSRRAAAPSANPVASRAAADGVEVDRGFDHGGERIEAPLDIGRLACLHETEMALRQGEMRVLRDRAEQRNADALEGRRDQRGMPRTRHPVQDHAGDRNIVAVARAARGDGGRRLGLSADVEHQHDRPAEQRRQVRRRAARGLAGLGHAVEQAHDALGDGDVGRCRVAGHQIGQRAGRHRPGVEVEARPAGGHGMEGRIDIVRPALEGLHGKAAAGERAHQAERHRGLAGARVRGPPPRVRADRCRVIARAPATTGAAGAARDRADHDDGRRADAMLGRIGRERAQACFRPPAPRPSSPTG